MIKMVEIIKLNHLKLLKKKTKSTKELLGNDKSINGLNFGFTESELFNDGDDIDFALQKILFSIRKVNNKQSQELIIDTSDILVDVDTFMERLIAIEEITGTTTNDLKILISTTISSNKNTIKNNEASTHTLFWICFFLMQFCTVVLVLNLLKKKRDMNQRKAI
ncbi:hypothetical protein EDI_229290 [Entamoeba dispar SAW760]|uniref:GOLD domain-containing protein n=1 Tax=Entamoeba dispar (strain ATCC PRA-260 / SAW760) TaxID=370354 RepID=B0EMQ0_ENTDS|nr:uncharacterized protein EDI_229290 [Entamoeba dispar SAW760]EDR24198.1 hypothetical protein EDI_229290 [Entamoeba dispar SAW760]|eukprot:EDR24198.1 hypothetical protein EDI_229290 [Entamoeba dispar SAW760]